VNVDPLDYTVGGEVSQALESRTNQGRAATAVIDELSVGRNEDPVSRDSFAQRRDLALDRLRIGLLFARHAGVKRSLPDSHAYLLRAACGLAAPWVKSGLASI
jgi:hypothetical protein